MTLHEKFTALNQLLVHRRLLKEEMSNFTFNKSLISANRFTSISIQIQRVDNLIADGLDQIFLKHGVDLGLELFKPQEEDLN